MRIDAANARTWLAAAIAAWALLVWALSLAGLGSRIAAIEDDAPGDALPPAAMPVAAEPPPLSRYGDVSARPLFTADRRPQPFFIDPLDEGDGASGDFDYVLTSVLRTPDFAMAILQPAGGGDSIRLRIGEAPPEASGWVLDAVDARSVVFAGPEGPRTLELRVFDGVGGQAPTPMRPPVAEAAPSGAPIGDGQRRRGPAPPATPASAPGPSTGTPAPPPTRAGSAAAATAPVDAAPPAGANGETTGTSEAQVEAIRRRIEERRARLQQEQATGGGPP